jgi:hypothetical protein
LEYDSRREMKRQQRIAATGLFAFWGILLTGSWLFAGGVSDLPIDDPPTLVGLTSWKIRAGDDPAWSRVDFDDSGWEKREIAGSFAGYGTFWLRTTIEVTGRFSESSPPMLSVYNLPSAYEIFWDGELIGRNGRWGRDRGRETPGTTRFLQVFRPDRAEPGAHLLAFRISNFHIRGKTIVTGIGLGPLGEMSGYIQRMVDRRLVSMGLYFVAALFVFFLFIRSRKYPGFVFFGAYAFLFFLHSVWIYAIEKMAIAVHLFARIEILVMFGIPIAFVLLNAFLLWHFEVRRRGIHLAILAVLLAAAAFLGTSLGEAAVLLSGAAVAYAFALAAGLAVRWKRGSGLALAGTGILAANHVGIFFVPGLAASLEALPGFAEMGLTALVLALFMGIIAIHVRDENRALEALRLRSQRLASELLKKSIQPHFLMNTLLSIQSWFGRDPDKAGRLIEALAEEFRIINRIVSEPEIDLAEELTLCRSHLDLMGYRRDAAYRLIVTGETSGLKIPPMLFHTLIENGLTHAYEARENGTFTLTCARDRKSVEYCLENDGSQLARVSGMQMDRLEEGLGLKYVRTRLEESFPGRWELEYGLRGPVWRVRIVIRGGTE